METPPFLTLQGESLIYNQENSELQYYIPAEFFESGSKNAIAEVVEQRVSLIGLFNYAIVDKNGKRGEVKLFKFPTMILCKPYDMENVKGLKLGDELEPADYCILKFKKGDEAISQIHVPQIIENVELFFKLATITAKIPTSISYDEGWKLFDENMDLNTNPYGLHSQLFGIVWRDICRDPKDISRPFRFTDMKNKHAYKPISVKLIPNYISPYTSIISENWDESLQSAILMKDKEDIPYSPLEKVVTM